MPIRIKKYLKEDKFYNDYGIITEKLLREIVSVNVNNVLKKYIKDLDEWKRNCHKIKKKEEK